MHAAADTEHEVVYGHRDFEYMLPSQIRASFLWAPYLANVTEHMQRWYEFIASHPLTVLCPTAAAADASQP